MAAAIASVPKPAYAQATPQPVFSSPPSPVGSGARAAGVGSAFIGLADDATAASWNPGGLTQLEKPEISIVGRGIWQIDHIGSGENTAVINDIEQTFTADGQRDDFESIGLNYLSATVPFSIAGLNLVASANYQQMLSFERDLHYDQNTFSADGIQAFAQDHLVQTGGVDAATFALAAEIVPGLSIGGAFNYWLDGLGYGYAWQVRHTAVGNIVFPWGDEIPIPEQTSVNTYYDFEGMNGTFGIMWRPDPSLQIGAVGKLPFTADVRHRSRFENQPRTEPIESNRLEFPASYGIGVSYRPDDRLTLSSDLTYVDWGDFRAIDAGGNEFLVTGDPANQYSVDGVFTPRVGAEYLWLGSGYKLAARGGLFYDPEPARNSARSFYGMSTGLGVTFPSFSLDFAYQARFGFDLKNTATTVNLLAVPGVPIDTFQNLFYASLVKYF